MFECPNCTQKTISKSSKFWIGPIRSITCNNCNARVSIPYKSLFLLTFFLVLMLMIPRLSINVGVIILILMAFCIVFVYLFYKLVPLEVKLNKYDAGYKKQKIRNSIIGFIYLLISFSLIYFISFPLQFESRNYIINDLSTINRALNDFDHSIGITKKNSLANKDFELEALELLQYRIARSQYGYKNKFSLIDYIDTNLLDGVNKAILGYEQTGHLSQIDLAYLKNIIETNNESNYILSKQTYKLNWNPFRKLQIPEIVKEYEKDMKSYLDNYLQTN